MKAKFKQWFDPLFLRTLTVVLLFWGLLMIVLTVNNYDRMKRSMEYNQEEARDSIMIDTQLVFDGEADWGRKPTIIAGRLSGWSYYSHYALGVYRIYYEDGSELARSQLTRGSVAPEGTGTYSIYLHFDPVFSKEEHLALAQLLYGSDQSLCTFYGYDSPAYGEVTGILDESTDIMLPQKLVYCYEDGSVVTLVDSQNEMFEGVELTTIRFDAANVYSSLVDERLSPEKLWDMYWEVDGALDELVAEHRPSTSGGASRTSGNVRASVGHYHGLSGYPIGYAYIYTPWTMATDYLKPVYVMTFLAALLAAVWISRMQKKSMQKERDLTRAMAHEFKTPAAVIRAYAEALREDIVPERREEYLSTLMDEADRMGGMVNELLELSRLNGAQTSQVREEVALKPLVESCFERLRLPMEERGLNLELNLLPAFCQGDPKRLERAISNLALNALHHAQPGPVRVMLGADGFLVVENRCPPIPEEVLSRLWEPFYKGDDSRSGEGSGLGLAIVKNIVELHGGTCRVELTNSGIRFLIRLN